VIGPINLATALSEFEVTFLSLNEPVANAELVPKLTNYVNNRHLVCIVFKR
jgi:hypothetical protein